MKKPTRDQLLNAFKTYLVANGYDRIEMIAVDNYGVHAHLKYAPHLRDFSLAERRYTTTGEPYYWVRLSKKDFNNELITNKLFHID
jgi:hypothetical protein